MITWEGLYLQAGRGTSRLAPHGHQCNQQQKILQKHGIHRVSRCLLSPHCTVCYLQSFLEAPDGKVPSGNWTCSDVRDVAKAHVLAAETPSAHGR